MIKEPDLDILIQAEAAYKGVVADPGTFGARSSRLVALARAGGSPEALVVALRAEAWSERTRLNDVRAKALLDEAARLASRHGLDARLGDVLVSRGAVNHELGLLAAAQRDFDRAAALLDPVSRGELGLQQAALHQNVGRFAEAAAVYTELLEQASLTPDVEAKVANNLALIEAQRGRPEIALQCLDRAALAAAAAGPALIAIVSQSRGWVLMQSGRLVESIRQFDAAAGLYAAAGLPLGEHYLEYSDALVELRLVPEARAMAQRATDQFRQHGVPLMTAEAQTRVAQLALLAGDPVQAIDAAESLLQDMRRQRRTAWAAKAAAIAAEAQAAAGTVSAAHLVSVRRAAGTLERLGIVWSAVLANLTAGRIALTLGRTATAADCLRRAHQLARHGPVLTRLRGRVAAALAAQACGRDREVLHHCRAGLVDLARHRAALASMELRALASGHGVELGEIGLATLLPTGSAGRVLAWMERTRAAALVAVEAPLVVGIEDELAALRTVQGEIAAIRRETGAEPPELLQRQATIEGRIRRASWTGEAATAAAETPITPPELRRLLAGRVLVEYGVRKGELVAVVLEPPRMRLVHLGRIGDVVAEADALMFSLRRLSRPRPTAGAAAARLGAAEGLRRLTELLLVPLGLPADVPLVVVPVGQLHRVPWSALHPAPVTIAPSASFWARTRMRQQSSDRVVLVAGPMLPGAVAEVHALEQLHEGATVLVPPSSTVGEVAVALRGAGLAHLACHGKLRSDNPTFSSLLFSDGPLTVHELALRGIAPHRIVLAACDSGADVTYEGNEMLGFVSALMARGTAGLVASMVLVPDQDAVPMMRRLHEEVLAGASLTDALHAARAEVDVESAGGFVTWCAFNAYGPA